METPFWDLGPVDTGRLPSRVASVEDVEWEWDRTRDRGVARETLSIRSGHRLWDELLIDIDPIASQITDRSIGKTVLSLVPSHSVIYPHVDQVRKPDLLRRIHVPLITHEDAYYVSLKPEIRKLHMSLRRAYRINPKLPHMVINFSNEDRIHLVFDYYEKGD